MTTKCLNCDKEFKTYKSFITRGRGKYCSKRCVGIAVLVPLSSPFKKGMIPWNKGKPHMRGKNHPMYGKHRIVWNKGLTSKIDPRVLSGEKVGSWKGGVISQNKKERERFNRTVQKTVFERDNYTCQLCGVHGGVLQVDHIQKWSEYVDQRFNIKNCRTLCMACHYKITFGKPMPKETKAWGWGNRHKHISI